MIISNDDVNTFYPLMETQPSSHPITSVPRGVPLNNPTRLTSAELAVRGGQEALITEAAEGSREVLTAAVETHARLPALVDVWRRRMETQYSSIVNMEIRLD